MLFVRVWSVNVELLCLDHPDRSRDTLGRLSRLTVNPLRPLVSPPGLNLGGPQELSRHGSRRLSSTRPFI